MKKTILIAITFGLLLSFLAENDVLAVDGDLNGDDVVNILDLVIIASHFGETIDATQMPSPDVNGDGTVNILDLVYVANLIRSSAPSVTSLVFGRGGDSLTLDPALVLDGESAKVCDMIYDTLIQYRDDTTEISPGLAEAWDSSADGLTWTFYLRQGVQFHDGTPLDADAVVFSFTRPKAVLRDFHAEFINQVIALDAYTVQIQLNASYAPFISTMAGTSFSIVSPAAVQHFGDSFGDDSAVGTGPFKFVQWEKGDRIVLEANEAHWAGQPPLDRFTFRSIPDNSLRLMELQEGNIHAMEFPNPEEIPLIETDPQLELAMQSSLNIGYLAMNFDKPPFDILKVRLAINHAINKTEIIDRLYQGTGIPAKNPIPPALWSYDETIEDYEYNPELAMQLLAEAGYPDGFETTL